MYINKIFGSFFILLSSCHFHRYLSTWISTTCKYWQGMTYSWNIHFCSQWWRHCLTRKDLQLKHTLLLTMVTSLFALATDYITCSINNDMAILWEYIYVDWLIGVWRELQQYSSYIVSLTIYNTSTFFSCSSKIM